MFKRKGFTLIELLIIIAAMAILLVMAVTAFEGMRDSATIAKVRGDLRTIRFAIESYYDNHDDKYPDVANYQTTLLNTYPKILSVPLNDPFYPVLSSRNIVDPSISAETYQYQYSLSGTSGADSKYFIIYSVGNTAKVGNYVGTNSPYWPAASVNANGLITVTGEPIWESNGHL